MKKKTIQKRKCSFLAVLTAIVISLQTLVPLPAFAAFTEIINNYDSEGKVATVIGTGMQTEVFTFSNVNCPNALDATSYLGVVYNYTGYLGGYTNIAATGEGNKTITLPNIGAPAGTLFKISMSIKYDPSEYGEKYWGGISMDELCTVQFNGNAPAGKTVSNVPADITNAECGTANLFNPLTGISTGASAPDAPTIDDAGLYFGGWYTDAACTDGNQFNIGTDAFPGNFTLYAKWVGGVTATFYLNYGAEGAYTTQTVASGSKLTAPTSPTRDGYTFGGWYKESGCVHAWNFASDTITAHTPIYANWTPNPITISFDNNGALEDNPANQTKNVDQKIDEPIPPTRAGCGFDGWTIGTTDTLFDFSKTLEQNEITENTTLKAKWLEVFTVTFNANGGSNPPVAQNINDGSYAAAPDATGMTRDGYTFNGKWYTDSACESRFVFTSTAITDTITLYAGWTANNITITLYANGGTLGGSGTINTPVNAAFEQPSDPTYDGHYFINWTKGDTGIPYVFSKSPDDNGITADATLKANWGNVYTVTFNANGGSNPPAEQNINDGSYALNPDATSMKRDGYKFDGYWYTKASCRADERFDFHTTPIKGNTELYAGWIHVHDFTYTVGTGISANVITATCGNADCHLTNNQVTLTIVKPTLATYDGLHSADAAVSLMGLADFNTATGKSIAAADIKYYKAAKSGTIYTKGDLLTAVPTDAGDYLAELTLEGVKISDTETGNVTASVGYTIAPAIIDRVEVTGIDTPTATSTLDTSATTSTANVTLGTVTWNPTTTPAAYATEYTATVTATADANYAFNSQMTATVNGSTATVTKNQDGTLSIAYTFEKTGMTPVTITATDKEVTWSADGIAIPVEGMFAIPEGAGTATYTVTDGTGEGTFAEGKLTVNKCGTFTVKVSTSATSTHTAGAETSATLTVNKTSAISATVTANHRTYDGTEKPLVTVTGTPTGGTMQYAIGTATEATEQYSTSIPAAANAGTYYVWYKAAGDQNHLDSEPVCVTVQITAAAETCVITFDANGGKGGMEPVTVDKGTVYTLPKCGFKAPANRKFSAWDKGAPGKKIEITEDTVIKAVWAVSKPAQGLLLPPKLTPSGSTALEVKWDRMNGAEGYDVFYAPCGSNQDAKLYKSIEKADKLSCKIKGLKEKTCYRVWVRGWIKDDDSKKIYLNGATEQAHAIAGGSDGKQTTPKKVTVKPSKVSVEVGKTATVQATVIGINQNLPVFVHSNLSTRWYSTDSSVAKVDGNGTIKGRKEGSCTVWAVAINGVRAKVTVEVVSKGTRPGKKDIGEAKISKIKDQTYTGKEITPKLTVKYNGKKLKEGTDYTVKWMNNKEIGKATGTVKGKGDYKGSQEVTFKIIKKVVKPKPVNLTELKAGKKQLTVKWEKGSDIDGYQIEYSRKEDFSESEKVTVKDAEKTSKKLKDLKKKKTYYVRIRTFKKAEDGKTYYSKWSDVMKEKTK